MRKFYLFFSLLLAAFWLKAQHIPDPNFAAAIRQQHPNCIDANDNLLPDAQTLTTLDVNTRIIFDLTGIAGFTNLDTLICYDNQLTTLPTLPNSLRFIQVGSNALTSLPPLPSSLTHLYLGGNRLTSLPTLPNSLLVLDFRGNQITNLPTLPNSLTTLNCSNNQLTAPLNLPNSLVNLDCNSNQLASLPNLPNSLVVLNCGSNQLVSLPNLPNSLTHLHCRSSQLTALPTLPNSLTYLNCIDNQLTVLPTLPNSLAELYCNINFLTELPNLPPNLEYLFAARNPLSCLPVLPSTLLEVQIDGTNISCLPNMPQNTIFDVALLICNSNNNPSNCPFYNQVQGQAYFDLNNNSVFDTLTDITLSNAIITGTPYYAAATGSAGRYTMYLDFNDTSDISLANGYNSNYFSVSPASYTVTTDSSSQVFSGRDFVLTALGTQVDLSVHISQGLHRPGFNSYFVITYSNVGNTVTNNGNLSLDLDPQVNFVSSSELAVQNGQNLAWTFSNLQPFETRQISVVVNLPASVPLASSINYNLNGTITQNDANENNNSSSAENIVIGAYDPNDINANKEVICTNSNDINEAIFYKIRFQNTGTFYAENVTVEDTLSNYLDISTLQNLSASHDYSLELKNVLRDNQPAVLAKWIFNNIHLIDSFTNEPLSHGFIEFQINPKADLLNLQSNLFVESQAHIYFDFNAPINTNIDSVSASICSNVSDLAASDAMFKIIPNPNNGNFTLLNPEMSLESANLFVYNLLGELVFNQKISGNNPQISLKGLPPAVYVIQLQTEKGNLSKKMIIE